MALYLGFLYPVLRDKSFKNKIDHTIIRTEQILGNVYDIETQCSDIEA